ncbi:MAG: GTP cyclohydrolase I [Glomeribacter sp. 1016415]|uniref:GTP cyclohydrolase FolE2 n=1 Tax=Mycoavidus cysteinexigens TaxID=1553431 RepID=A0A2Z6EUS3_9BURK|nr:GTP cyclohydrolase FolE2 [Mycoavidus cysteinexigens]MCX8567295.1 GTP cyclohydrolase I [Glomeribacter sp. 1016415]BBE09161.1 GTP cyclohydrolase [Mycoavidus cysteinexigens]GAM52094.1 GTP cyclohydrolase I [bacterium endosymbiont of Mortierella elongata FMR23-6]GLR01892.1 GTP cyclohydrolase FolE2 [Mycoavidus cysteinexigens]
MNGLNSVAVMSDVQGSIDTRQIPIQRVGIKAVRHPLTVRSATGASQPTVGLFDLDVYLPSNQKGTHMSRFIALLGESTADAVTGDAIVLDLAGFQVMLMKMLTKLESTAGRIEVTFPYFMNKTAPISGVKSLLDYEVSFIGEAQGERSRIFMKVLVPVMSLCPCSKEISLYGAHNQRSHLIIKAELQDDQLPVEDLIRIAEESASCELWGLLKRPDEKFVTERAYDNPKFVEDLVRDVASRLNQDDRVVAYVLEAENFESIHNHSAYALVEHDKRQSGLKSV